MGYGPQGARPYQVATPTLLVSLVLFAVEAGGMRPYKATPMSNPRATPSPSSPRSCFSSYAWFIAKVDRGLDSRG